MSFEAVAGDGIPVPIDAGPGTECRVNQRETRGGDIRHCTACSYPEFARSGRPIDGGKRQQRLAPAGQIVHLLRQLQSVSRACTLSDLLGQAKPALAVFRWPARTLRGLFLGCGEVLAGARVLRGGLGQSRGEGPGLPR